MKRLYTLLSVLVLASMALAACGGDATATEMPATEMPATEMPATEMPATEMPATEASGAFECTDELGCVTIAPGEPVHVAYWGVLSGADGTLVAGIRTACIHRVKQCAVFVEHCWVVTAECSAQQSNRILCIRWKCDTPSGCMRVNRFARY